MATVAETVKGSLLGTSEPEELSPSSRTTFLKHARRDEDTDELYMGEEEFVNAIAPPDQDYVSLKSPPLRSRSPTLTIASHSILTLCCL
jgi:solute carrier family 25 (mitochondrial aspartate/glutamate transporter), member 12/13